MDKKIDAKKIERASEYDKLGGVWEVDAEKNILRKKIVNAIRGSEPVEFMKGDKVGFSTVASFGQGVIRELKKESCIIELDNGTLVEVPFYRLFKPEENLF